jgi:hypothetical protein
MSLPLEMDAGLAYLSFHQGLGALCAGGGLAVSASPGVYSHETPKPG